MDCPTSEPGEVDRLPGFPTRARENDHGRSREHKAVNPGYEYSIEMVLLGYPLCLKSIAAALTLSWSALGARSSDRNLARSMKGYHMTSHVRREREPRRR